MSLFVMKGKVFILKNACILHIPHSSLRIPQWCRGQFACSDGALEENLLALTDWQTDELFAAPGFDNRLVYLVSRLVCDPERFRDDSLESMAERGMGAVYTHDAWCREFRSAGAEEKRRLLAQYYDPHHRALDAMARESLRRSGRCLVLDCHSFSAGPLPFEPVQERDRPDFCLGTDPDHTPSRLIEAMMAALDGMGYTVRLNTPYAGTLLPLALLGEPKLYGITIEVNRGLYMEERRFARAPGWADTKRAVGILLDTAARVLMEEG